MLSLPQSSLGNQWGGAELLYCWLTFPSAIPCGVSFENGELIDALGITLDPCILGHGCKPSSYTWKQQWHKWTALHSSSSPQPSVLCGTRDREDDLSLSFSMKVQCLNVSVPKCLLPHRWSMRRWIDDYGTLWKKCRSFWIHWMNRTGREVGSVY